MSHPSRIGFAVPQPKGVTVIEVVPGDCRLVTGLEAGPSADATHLADDLSKFADQTSGPIVLNLGGVNWIDSGACAVLIRFWKELRARGRTLTLTVTSPVRETFRITGLIRLIPCFGELDSAIEAARTAQPTGEP
jgi:anti-anti-sigma factor